MSMTDPVADMLTRIRNACSAGHRRVDVPASKLKVELARLLLENHYIAECKVLEDGGRGGLRQYVKCREIPRVKNGLGMAIVSTPKGLMTDRQARTANLGGELLAVVW